MKFFPKTLFFLAGALGFSLAIVPIAGAEGGNPNDYLHMRSYLGVVGTSVSVGNTGLFSGQNYSRINSPTYEVDLIPSITQNFGFGLLIGHREDAYAMEVSYWQSNHSASFGPAVLSSVSGTSVTLSTAFQDTAVYNSVNVDFKRYFFTELQFQPFINFGVSFPWVVVSNAAEDGNGNIASVTLAGLGVNLGIGAEFYLTPNISLTGGAYQRWASFNQFKGFAGQYYPLIQNGGATSGDGSGLIFSVGTTVGFQ